MASDPLYAEDEMELTSSEINLPHNLDAIEKKSRALGCNLKNRFTLQKTFFITSTTQNCTPSFKKGKEKALKSEDFRFTYFVHERLGTTL